MKIDKISYTETESGIIVSYNNGAITIASPNGGVTIPESEIHSVLEAMDELECLVRQPLVEVDDNVCS